MSGRRLSKEQYTLQVAMHPKFMVHASTVLCDTEPGKDGEPELLAETPESPEGWATGKQQVLACQKRTIWLLAWLGKS